MNAPTIVVMIGLEQPIVLRTVDGETVDDIRAGERRVAVWLSRPETRDRIAAEIEAALDRIGAWTFDEELAA